MSGNIGCVVSGDERPVWAASELIGTNDLSVLIPAGSVEKKRASPKAD